MRAGIILVLALLLVGCATPPPSTKVTPQPAGLSLVTPSPATSLPSTAPAPSASPVNVPIVNYDSPGILPVRSAGSVQWQVSGTGDMQLLGVVRSLAFVVTDARYLHAFEVYGGKQRWQYTPEIPESGDDESGVVHFAPPLVVDNTVYVHIPGHELAALRLSDGELLWRIHSPSAEATLTLASGLLLFGESGSTLNPLYDREGQDAPDLTAPIRAAAISGGIHYQVDETMKLSARHMPDDRLLWSQQLAVEAQPGALPLLGDLLFVPSPNGTLVAIDTQTGKVRWQISLPADFRSISAAQTHVYLSLYSPSKGNALASLDVNSGTLFWTLWLEQGEAVAGEQAIYIYYPDSPQATASLESRDPGSGDVIWSLPPASLHNAIFQGRMIYLQTDQQIVAVNAYTGNLYWSWNTDATLAKNGLNVLAYDRSSVYELSQRGIRQFWSAPSGQLLQRAAPYANLALIATGHELLAVQP